jgi:DNA-binding CsgD family transcriptional regulator
MSPEQRLKALKLLQAKADGVDAKEAAIEQGINVNTSKNILKRFYDEIGADGCSHAIAILLRRGEIK